MEINTELLGNLVTNGFFTVNFSDIISILLGSVSLVATFLTLQTTRSLKKKIYDNARCQHLIPALQSYMRNIKSIEVSAADGLELSSNSLQKDLGACIIELKDAKPLLHRRQKKKIDSLDQQYQSIINCLSKQGSENDICRQIMELCQKTKVLINDIISKLESEKL